MRFFIVSGKLQHHLTIEGYGKNSLHCLQIEVELAVAAVVHRSQLLAWEKLL
jgi:hypothetical protein